MKNKINQLSDVDAAYLAGLIDGEGTIGLSVVHKGNRRSPVVSIANTDYGLVDWPLQITGIGCICKKGSKREKHHLDSWIYVVQRNNALDLLNQVYPYLKNKSKRARAKLLLEQYRTVTPRNGRYSTDQLAQRQEFEKVFLES